MTVPQPPSLTSNPALYHLPYYSLQSAFETLMSQSMSSEKKEKVYADITRYALEQENLNEFNALCAKHHLKPNDFFEALYKTQTPMKHPAEPKEVEEITLEEPKEQAETANEEDDYTAQAMTYVSLALPVDALSEALKIPPSFDRDSLLKMIMELAISLKSFTFACQILSEEFVSDDLKIELAGNLWQSAIEHSKLEVAKNAFNHVPEQSRKAWAEELIQHYTQEGLVDCVDKAKAFKNAYYSQTRQAPSHLSGVTSQGHIFLYSNAVEGGTHLIALIAQGKHQEAAEFLQKVSSNSVDKLIQHLLTETKTTDLRELIQYVENPELFVKVSNSLLSKLPVEECLAAPRPVSDYPEKNSFEKMLQEDFSAACEIASTLPPKCRNNALVMIYEHHLRVGSFESAATSARGITEPVIQANCFLNIVFQYLSREKKDWDVILRAISKIGINFISDLACKGVYDHLQELIPLHSQKFRETSSNEDRITLVKLEEVLRKVREKTTIPEMLAQAPLSKKRKSESPERKDPAKAPNSEDDFLRKTEIVECLTSGDYTKAITLAKTNEKALKFIIKTLLENEETESLRYLVPEMPEALQEYAIKEIVFHYLSKSLDANAFEFVDEIENKKLKDEGWRIMCQFYSKNNNLPGFDKAFKKIKDPNIKNEFSFLLISMLASQRQKD